MKTIHEYKEKYKDELPPYTEDLCYCGRPFTRGPEIRNYHIWEKPELKPDKIGYQCMSCGHINVLASVRECPYCGQTCVAENIGGLADRKRWKCSECGMVKWEQDR